MRHVRARHRRAFVVPLGVLALLGAACSTLLGLGDLERVACLEPCSDSGRLPDGALIDPDGGLLEDGSSGDGGAADADASGGFDAEAGATLCNDLMLWIPFEGDSKAHPNFVDAAAIGSNGAETFVAGKFGQGAEVGKASSPETYAWDIAWEWRTKATVMMWVLAAYNGDCGGAERYVFWSGAGPQGPTLRCNSAMQRLELQSPFNAGYDFALAPSLNPNWNNTGFVHVAATWENGDLVSEGATRIYVDGQGTDAKRMKTSNGGGRLVLGNPTALPNAVYDDIAVWKRVLSQAEVNLVRTSGMTVGQMCNVK